MSGPFVVDASVFLNAFIPSEDGHEISKDLLARLLAKGVPMIAPTLVLPETAAAIRRGQDNPDLARQFAGTISRLPHLTLVPFDRLLAQQALDAAAVFRLRGSDAVYVSVAQRYACPKLPRPANQSDPGRNNSENTGGSFGQRLLVWLPATSFPIEAPNAAATESAAEAIPVSGFVPWWQQSSIEVVQP